MKLGLVIGSVTATRKTGGLDGLKLMLVQGLNEELAPAGPTFACADTVNAGPGDVVLLCSSSSARLTAVTGKTAADTAIVGIIDAVCSGKEYRYSTHDTALTPRKA